MQTRNEKLNGLHLVQDDGHVESTVGALLEFGAKRMADLVTEQEGDLGGWRKAETVIEDRMYVEVSLGDVLLVVVDELEEDCNGLELVRRHRKVQRILAIRRLSGGKRTILFQQEAQDVWAKVGRLEKKVDHSSRSISGHCSRPEHDRLEARMGTDRIEDHLLAVVSSIVERGPAHKVGGSEIVATFDEVQQKRTMSFGDSVVEGIASLIIGENGIG